MLISRREIMGVILIGAGSMIGYDEPPKSDEQIIAEVNELTRIYTNKDIPFGEKPLPEGFRCDLCRVGLVREKWNEARENYKKVTNIDVLDALARHEAGIRRNAAELHIDRRKRHGI
jgi:hypothetical protein